MIFNKNENNLKQYVMHKNRTYSGLLKEKAHDERYKKMLIGKVNDKGKIINAEYIGNAVYGIVKLYFEDGSDNLYSDPHAFRPKKENFNLNQ